MLKVRKPWMIESELNHFKSFNATTPLQISNVALRVSALENELEEAKKHYPEAAKTESELANDKAVQSFMSDPRFSKYKTIPASENKSN